MSGGGGGGDDFAVEEEHENHERYLVTYADMITLLMALFVILYAMSGPPQETDYAEFARRPSEQIVPLDGGIGVFKFGASEAPPEAVTYVEQDDNPQEVDAAHAADLARQLEGSATGGTGSGTGEGYGIDSTVDERGVVLTVPNDALLFAPGQSEIGDPGRQILAQVAEVLKGTTNELLIEGHTDSKPIAGDSNWVLSSRRAASVAEVLIAAGIDPKRLVVQGYADTHPVADNSTEEGRRQNRRVELVVKVQFSGATPATLGMAAPDPIGNPITGEDVTATSATTPASSPSSTTGSASSHTSTTKSASTKATTTKPTTGKSSTTRSSTSKASEATSGSETSGGH